MLGLSRSGNWNENNLNPLLRINCRASPSPIAYIKVVAVKKLVVSLLVGAIGPTLCVGTRIVSYHPWGDPVWY